MAQPEFISLTQTLIFQLPMGVVIQNIIYSLSASRSVSPAQVHLSNAHKQEPITSECLSYRQTYMKYGTWQ